MRQERSRPLIVDLAAWLREQRAKLSRNNDTTKAINYCLSRRDAFSRFLDDGRLCMSTMLLSGSYGRSPWGEKIGPSPGLMRAADVRLPSTASSPPPSSTASTHRLGLPTSWRAYRITLPSALTNCCLGIGSLKASLTPLKRDQPYVKKRLSWGPSPDAYAIEHVIQADPGFRANYDGLRTVF